MDDDLGTMPTPDDPFAPIANPEADRPRAALRELLAASDRLFAIAASEWPPSAIPPESALGSLAAACAKAKEVLG